MDEITHTILPNNGGLSGTALGAGFGGLNTMNAQTAAIINALKPATTTTG